MNIFVLDTNPEIAASYHCDQHLHKMILESAQMLSTVFCVWHPKQANLVYKPAYQNHPCTLWVRNRSNALWTLTLAYELESIRFSLNCPRHSSMDVLDVIKSYLDGEEGKMSEFIFAGSPSINILNLSVVEKYKKYYRRKHNAWLLDKGAGMSYKGRPVPDFMADLIPVTP